MSTDDGFEKFCGSPVWDTNLTWNTRTPDFTQCFQKSCLVWTPCAFIWIALPFYARILHSEHRNPIPLSNLNVAKTIVSIFMVLVLWVELLLSFGDLAAGRDLPLVDYVSPTVHMLTYVVVTCLIQVERLRGYITSGVIWVFVFLETIAGIIPFYSKILAVTQNDGVVEDVGRFVLFYLYYACVLTFLILVSFAESSARSSYFEEPAVCPEITSSFPSRLTFSWLNSLVWTSFRNELTEDDVFPLNKRDVSEKNAPIFQKAWEAEVRRKKKGRRPQGVVRMNKNSPSRSQAGERTPLLAGSSDPKVEIRTGQRVEAPKPSIMMVLTKTYGPTLALSWCCKLVYDALQFVSPQLLSLLIEYAANDSIEAWKGYFYAFMFFVVAAAQSVFFHQMFHIGMTLGMRIKSAVIAAIYQKALTMSNDERKHATVGEIVNLMSVDAQRLQDVTGYLWMLISSPLQICVAVWMLWMELGPAVLAGVAVMILLIPINGVIAGISRKLQIKQMKFKDARIKLMNEILNGMKVLKLYAWEESFQAKIDAIRANELKTLRKTAYLSAIATFTWTCAPFVVTLASFTVFVLTSGEPLTSRKAFTSLSLFNILRFPMNLLPMLVTYVVTASVSVKRISEFLQNGDIDKDAVTHDRNSPDPVVIENGTFNWGEETVLHDVDVTIPDGKLVAVVGTVGAGKSSLLAALLGEMEKERGRVNTRGSIAYVAQQAWIQNMTLKDNILFGKDLQNEKYENVIEACALGPDLKILPGGDNTEIGEKGINLSGGQKQRVSLARAVYSDADIYLLDDPLSAVDSHVGKHIFERVIGEDGLLRNKTRVLVTHGLHWLPYVDEVIVMTNGHISEQGKFEDLINHGGPFAQLIKQHLTTERPEEDEDPEIEELKKTILERATSVTSDEEVSPKKINIRRLSSISTQDLLRAISKEDIPTEDQKQEPPVGKPKLIEEEKMETGKVKWSVFLTYISALRIQFVMPFLFLFVAYWVANILSSIWLSKWSTDTLLNNASLINTSEYINQRDYYLGVYGGLGVAQAVFILIYSLGLALCMIMASRRLHFAMLSNILKAPMAFFDTTPIGRIVNRFSRDVETIDTILPGTFRSYLSTLFTVLSTIVIIIYSTWYFIALIVPLAIIYYLIQRVYIPTSRQLKRIESTTRSPIYVHFSETLTGVQTIRAYGFQEEFMRESEEKVDKNLMFYFAGIASNRWLGYRLELVGSFVVLGAALFAVAGRGQPGWDGIVGLSVSYALQVTGALNFMVRMASDLETNVVSVERVIEYSQTENEADWDQPGVGLDPNWPETGNIDFSGYSTRYREGLDLVLNNVSFQIFAGEKVGIVGRTGAGKSSLTLSLFRIIEATGGKILIDGLDISRLGLHQLRKRITILPQDPVLFSGTLRMNLDPFEDYSDAKIWGTLESAHLNRFVASKPEGLSYECGEGGQNLSVGQRQLICLARALLRKTKILVLDEATAAVDVQTDELIQSTIRTEFADCTVLTIAHRLNSIMDSDRVMVLDQGRVKEFNTPMALIEDNSSAFYSMARDAGIV